MKKFKILSTLTASVCLALCISSGKAYAKVNAYLIKNRDTSAVYKYNLEELSISFMNLGTGENDLLYKNFQEDMKKSTICGYENEKGEYVDYSSVSQAFLDSADKGSIFDLNGFVEGDKAQYLDLDENINEVYIGDDEVKFREVFQGPKAKSKAKVEDSDVKLFKRICIKNVEVEGGNRFKIEGCNQYFDIGETAEVLIPNEKAKIYICNFENDVLAEGNLDISKNGQDIEFNVRVNEEEE
ncbi:hypothetical protein OW763_09250 [Clostridium aestuarii]|uniref:Uncharacterized protein n=1 Tax=Clostridium aestuarii TaxID=338193 RepID=A0ABT4D2V5_9CLOT|nr:hypothetical protein [Clostridium aestuarii]MCY6484525.1 hypothetical protein [Clostridium aestuarii]